MIKLFVCLLVKLCAIVMTELLYFTFQATSLYSTADKIIMYDQVYKGLIIYVNEMRDFKLDYN